MAPKADTEIDPIFIDDNDILAKDDLTDKNKQFIKTLLDRSNYNDFFSDDDNEQLDLIQSDLVGGEGTRTDYNLLFENETFKIKPTIDVLPKEEIDLPTIYPTINVTTANSDDDVVYVRYIPPPSQNPPPLVHPRDKYKQKVKQLQKKKNEYRKKVKKRATQTLVKKKRSAIKNALLKSTMVD